ncbi:hypothetical protein MKEN_01417600 [Mycena kentingensis (nom. inval.)]|nr:hypothetical protein MKEN_01417600 [Mycena kentingensis (nom. inval.)]
MAATTSSITRALPGEIFHAAHSASVVYPPLQATLGLVEYINQSIDQFKANRKEVKAIGEYSKSLAGVLGRLPAGTKTERYISVIVKIETYLREVSAMKRVVQLLQRKKISGKLQGFRGNLEEEFTLFSIASDLDLAAFQQAAEIARQRDDAEVHQMLKEIAESLTVEAQPSAVRELANGIGIASDVESVRALHRELESMQSQSTDAPQREQFEETVLKASTSLTSITISPKYQWFSATFKKEYQRSQIAEALLPSISDIVATMRDSGVLAPRTKAKLAASRRDPLEQIDEIFGVLDGRPRDASLIRTFQRAVVRVAQLDDSDFLNPSLWAELGMQ